MDFLLFLTFGEGVHDEAGEEIGEEESDESEPRVSKGDGDGGAKQPITVADPFAFGKEIEHEVNPAENEDGQ